MPIKLLIADDQVIIREGLKSLLRGTDVEIVAEAESGEAVVRLARMHSPDVALFDVHMPIVNGLSALEQIKAAQPELPVLIWSAFENTTFASAAAALGASGYLTKSAGRAELLEAIREAAAGHVDFGDRPARIKRSRANLADEIVTPLTRRQTDVLRLLALGAANSEIAATLQIELETVKSTNCRLFRRIGVSDRAQAAVWAARKGLI